MQHFDYFKVYKISHWLLLQFLLVRLIESMNKNEKYIDFYLYCENFADNLLDTSK